MAEGDILFNNIPASGLTAPIMSFEVNSGGQYDQVDRFIVFGHKTGAGTLAYNKPVPAYDQATVDGYAGPGSMLREMFRVASANAPATPIWLVAVQENGVAPVWTWTVGALPGVGVGTIEICKERIDIPVTSADTSATIAAAINAAIGNYYNQLTNAMLPVTATVASAVVTMTGRHASALLNEVDFHIPTISVANNLFAQPGVLTLAQTTQGAGTPLLAPALAALGDDPADYIVSPWSDSTSRQAYSDLNSDASGRWAWNRQVYGHAWYAAVNNFAGLTTLGLSCNDRHSTTIPRIPSVPAAGNVAFTTNPTTGTNVNINGTSVGFVTSGATGNQVNIGGSLATTLTSLLALLSGSSDTNLIKATYALSGTTLQATSVMPGSVGNALTLSTTVSGATASGATFAGGLNGCPEPSWLWVAGMAARVAPWLSDCDTGNVSRNHTGLVVQGLHGPRDRVLIPNYSGRNTLNNSGISTWSVNVDGSVKIEKIVTNYRTGASGQPDAVFRDVQALYQTAGGLKFMRAQLANDQSNKGIVDSNPGNLGALTTPTDIKGTLLHAYGTLVLNGVFEDVDTYAISVKVQRDGQNRGRVNVYNPMQRVSPLDILAANATIYQRFPQVTA